MRTRWSIDCVVLFSIATACGGKSATVPGSGGAAGASTDMGSSSSASTGSSGEASSTSTFGVNTGAPATVDGSTGTSGIGSSGPIVGSVATGTTVGSGRGTGGAAGGPREAGASGGLGGSSSFSIVVSPATSELPSGATEQLVATELFADGSSYDATAVATWTTDVPNVVRVAAGRVMASGPGTVNVIATLAGVSGQASVTVPNNMLLGIAITPNPATIAVQGTVDFTATGTFSDGTTGNLNARAKWSIDDPAIASLAANVARGVAVGTTKVHASIGAFTSDATLIVADPP
jgi:hypothetical protein